MSIIVFAIGYVSCRTGLHDSLNQYEVLSLSAYIVIFIGLLLYFLIFTNFGNDIDDVFQIDFILRNFDLSRSPSWVEQYTLLKSDQAKELGYGTALEGISSRIRTFIGANSFAAFGSVVLIYFGVAFNTARLLSRTATEPYLRNVRALTKYSLYSVGGMLTLGVLSESSLHSWALIFARPYEHCLQNVVDQLKLFIGVSYSISIGLAFLPIFAAWTYKVNEMSLNTSVTGNVLPKEWRKASDLELTLIDFLRSFAAVVLPAIVPSALSFLSKIPI